MHRISKHLVAACLAAAACAPQANEEYLGEPLLRMRGSVSTSSLTTTQPIVPALCFVKEIEPRALRRDQLPAEVQAAFEGSGLVAGSSEVHILDVQAHGQFPAEFNVDVYAPPPEQTIASPFSGEPRAAWGTVCAVQVEHKPVGQVMASSDTFQCAGPSPEGACLFTDLVSTEDGSRYYYRQLDCPNFTAPPEQCDVRQGGDETLLAETGGYEGVVAVDEATEVVYLADPAPAGSYAAYRLGAPDGLSAGYHLRKQASAEELRSRSPAVAVATQRALDETNELLGTDYPSLPEYGGGVEPARRAPPEVVDTYERIRARIEMETIPMTIRAELAPNDPGLTLSLEPVERFGRPMLAPELRSSQP